MYTRDVKIFRLLVLLAFMAPIIPAAADLCCADESAPCPTVSGKSESGQIASGDVCGERHSDSSACETCSLCHASFLSATFQSSRPTPHAGSTLIKGFIIDADPVRLVLTPPPSFA